MAVAELFAPSVVIPRRSPSRVLKLDGGELQRDALPGYLQDLSDRELRSRLVIGFVGPLRLATR